MMKFITLSIFICSLIFVFACGGSDTAEESAGKDNSGGEESSTTSQYGEGVFTIAKGEMSDRRKDHVVLLMPDG